MNKLLYQLGDEVRVATIYHEQIRVNTWMVVDYDPRAGQVALANPKFGGNHPYWFSVNYGGVWVSGGVNERATEHKLLSQIVSGAVDYVDGTWLPASRENVIRTYDAGDTLMVEASDSNGKIMSIEFTVVEVNENTILATWDKFPALSVWEFCLETGKRISGGSSHTLYNFTIEGMDV